jgi:hypothetical protein
MMKKFLNSVFAMLCLLGMASVARAEEMVANQATPPMEYQVTPGMQYRNGFWYMFSGWVPGVDDNTIYTKRVTEPADPSDIDFKHMMDAAGFAVKTVKIGTTVYPRFSMGFGLKRAISEYDRENVERLLRKHKRKYSSPTATAERLIVRTILDLQDLDQSSVAKIDRGLMLSKVDVTLLPLPMVEFTAEPRTLSLAQETNLILQSIEELNAKLAEIK